MTDNKGAVVKTDSSGDVAALAGLRRMVIHARDRLEATQIKFTTDDEFRYNEHLRPAEIRRMAAMLLANQVLTLVADCLPADGSLSPDEAEQLQRKHQRTLDALQASVDAQMKTADELRSRVSDLENERDLAVEWQTAAEEEAENWRVQWKTATELARTDAAAAVRYLDADGVVTEAQETAEPEPANA